MTARTILHSFDVYRIARMSFVQTVADLALRSQNIEVLVGAGVLDLLKSLLDDVCPQIQQCAAIALGRIAHHSTDIGEKAIETGLLTILLCKLDSRNKHYRRAAMFVLRSVCRHNVTITEHIVSGSGAIEAMMLCLIDLDPQVREAAAWAAGYIARGNAGLAKVVVDAGAVPQLVLCLQEPELTLRRVAASALADISRHTHDLAVTVINSNAITHLCRAATDRDDNLKRQALLGLSALARQELNASESIVQSEIFPDTFILMGHRCVRIRRNAAMLVRDIVKHTPELAQYMVNTGAVGALVEAVKSDGKDRPKDMTDEEDYRIPAVAAIGYIAGHGQQLAMCVVNCDGVTALIEAIQNSSFRSELKSSSAWALGQIGRYCPDAISAAGVLPLLLEITKHAGISEELRSRSLNTLRLCVQGCTTMSVLEPLLHQAPPDIMKYVLGQLSKVLPGDPRARRLFVTSGGLKRLQEIEAEPGSQVMEYITLINTCFPEEIVRFYTPGYSDILLQKVEEYKPKIEGTEERIAFDHDSAPAPSRTVSKELAILFDD